MRFRISFPMRLSSVGVTLFYMIMETMETFLSSDCEVLMFILHMGRWTKSKFLFDYDTAKGKAVPLQAWTGLEDGQRYSSTLPWPRRLKGMGGQQHNPAALSPGKTRYPLYRRLGGPQGRSGRVRKISPPTGYFLLFQIQVTNFSFSIYSFYKSLQETQSYAGL
jgi:hypothetical protein